MAVYCYSKCEISGPSVELSFSAQNEKKNNFSHCLNHRQKQNNYPFARGAKTCVLVHISSILCVIILLHIFREEGGNKFDGLKLIDVKSSASKNCNVVRMLRFEKHSSLFDVHLHTNVIWIPFDFTARSSCRAAFAMLCVFVGVVVVVIDALCTSLKAILLWIPCVADTFCHIRFNFLLFQLKLTPPYILQWVVVCVWKCGEKERHWSPVCTHHFRQAVSSGFRCRFEHCSHIMNFP